MSTTSRPSTTRKRAPSEQRKALDRSEKEAAAKQPGTYKDDETARKVVEVGPDMTDAPIDGIDAPEDGRIDKSPGREDR